MKTTITIKNDARELEFETAIVARHKYWNSRRRHSSTSTRLRLQ